VLILGIETSCDETAVAVVENGKRIVANALFSSIFAHKEFGGVVPEIAVRVHLEKINLILKKAKVDFNKIDAIAVTYGPGLIGALLVGVSFAKALAFKRKIPLIKINHLIAHLYAPFLNPPVNIAENKNQMFRDQVFPAVGAIISGGHSSLIYLKSFKDCQLLGQTRDDAAGEAFDKVAKILNLGYPGGPIIDKLASKGEANIKFNCASLKSSLDFSFSGVKTAVLYKYKCKMVNKNPKIKSKSKIKENLKIKKADIAASFQKAVVDVLVKKAIAACLFKKCKNLILGGGVTANSYFRKEILKKTAEQGINLFYPLAEFCTDNAAMVAGLAYHLYDDKKYLANLNLAPCADLGI